jgi:hypothetical protein
MELKREYSPIDDTDFNIFSSISDVYHYENLHSHIIALILNPRTKKIGNEKNIALFIELLNKIKPELQIKFDGKICIEREEERIDVLIHDENSAIIIENKMNDAEDQENQISNYYEKVEKKMRKNVMAIIYLTLTSDKVIDEKKSIENNKYKGKIKNLFVPVYVINPKNMEHSFSEGFIKKCIECIEDTKENELARVYYTQYYELIKSLGGNSMKMAFYQGTLQEIYTDADKLAIFREFGDLWDNRAKVFAEMAKRLLVETSCFKEYPGKPDIVCRKINDTISLGYDSNNAFGYIRTPECAEADFVKRHEELSACFENKDLKDIFVNKNGKPECNGFWVYKQINVDKIADIITVIYNFNVFEKLLEKQ